MIVATYTLLTMAVSYVRPVAEAKGWPDSNCHEKISLLHPTSMYGSLALLEGS